MMIRRETQPASRPDTLNTVSHGSTPTSPPSHGALGSPGSLEESGRAIVAANACVTRARTANAGNATAQ